MARRLLLVSRAYTAIWLCIVFVLMSRSAAIACRRRLPLAIAAFWRNHFLNLLEINFAMCNALIFGFRIDEVSFWLWRSFLDWFECAVLTMSEWLLARDIVLVVGGRLDVRGLVSEIYQWDVLILARYRRYRSVRRFSFSILILKNPA